MTMHDDEAQPVEMTRRRMLMRLGLAASAVYATPVVLQLSDAKASGFSGKKSVSFSRGRAHHGRRRATRAYAQPARRPVRRGKTAGRLRRRYIKSFS